MKDKQEDLGRSLPPTLELSAIGSKKEGVDKVKHAMKERKSLKKSLDNTTDRVSASPVVTKCRTLRSSAPVSFQILCQEWRERVA